MTPELYTWVILLRDIPQAQLKAGDMAMYIDTLTHPQHEPAAVLEVFNTMGDSLDVVTVPLSAITPLTPDYMPTARRIERTTP